MIPHRLDPPAQIAAAETLGRVRARLPWDEPVAPDLLDTLVSAGGRAAITVISSACAAARHARVSRRAAGDPPRAASAGRLHRQP